ncbi:hypothetical protein [Bailinhaonella thermotolerans]|uniref:Uncharacterized protein n=1 Tax=Bailinhaonella thermotolerans TaxID=1070861 RepID=A0A3A4AWG1_9ACTN|nr:hypothetical protein [Bailinhaonella thermotolerans]RJL33213.1 hypothetical protein D5H75_10260 [Bailinhaonella thermotolerans]
MTVRPIGDSRQEDEPNRSASGHRALSLRAAVIGAFAVQGGALAAWMAHQLQGQAPSAIVIGVLSGLLLRVFLHWMIAR